jgi:phosphoribosylanthranilate isomerase
MHIMNSEQSTPLVKVCGTTSPQDAQLAQQAGADYLGIIIEHAPSPRSVSLQSAVAIAEAVHLASIEYSWPSRKLL